MSEEVAVVPDADGVLDLDDLALDLGLADREGVGRATGLDALAQTGLNALLVRPEVVVNNLGKN